MAIFVTQDDSGSDNDSIDRHRSFVLCNSPWAKRGYVSHQHTSIMSIIRTIYRLHGLPPNNLYDATANDLNDMFTEQPDFSPCFAVPSDPRVFKPEDTFDPTDPKLERRRSHLSPDGGSLSRTPTAWQRMDTSPSHYFHYGSETLWQLHAKRP
jgi:hypothetical protein